jgi:hypothetical protein
MMNTDPNRPVQEILDEIRQATATVVNQAHNPNLGLAMILAPFAALLVRLGKDAAETADKNLRIQKRLIWLTVAVLAVSVLTLVLAFFQYQQGD